MNKASNFVLLIIANILFSYSVLAVDIKPDFTYKGVGNEKIRSCDGFECSVIKYGGYDPEVTLLEFNNDWYKIKYKESNGVVTEGWIYYSLVPDDILMELGENIKIKENISGLFRLKKDGLVYNCPSKNNCTHLAKVKKNDVIEVVGIDDSRMWYKVKLNDSSMESWDQWMEVDSFVGQVEVDVINSKKIDNSFNKERLNQEFGDFLKGVLFIIIYYSEFIKILN